MERTHQADELSENDTSGSLSEQISDHDTPGETSKRYHLACHEIAKKFGGAQDMSGFLERNWIVPPTGLVDAASAGAAIA